ncbi:MAG TPA: SpoIIE family protein phosphatase [Stenomitos sp.]
MRLKQLFAGGKNTAAFLGGTVGLIAIMGVLGWSIFSSFKGIDSSLEELITSSNNNQSASYLVTNFLKGERLQGQYLMAKTLEERHKIFPELSDVSLDVRAATRALVRFYATPEQKERVNTKIRPLIRQWTDLNDELIELVDSGKAAQAIELKNTKGLALTDAILDFIFNELTEVNEKIIEAQHAEANRKIKRAIEQLLVGSLLIGLVGIAFVVLVAMRFRQIELLKEKQQTRIMQMGKEMEIATRIQTALIPQNISVEGYDATLDLITATEVGGDLIDMVPMPEGRFWLAVGDVTGHGLTPGLVMMMAQSIFTGLVMDRPDAQPSDIIIQLNQALHQNVKYRLCNDNYMTLQLIRYLGEGRFVGAGMHCDILIYRAATKTVDRIETPGFWTGFIDDVRDLTVDYEFEMGPNDLMLLYTDGLIEAKNAEDEQYDMDRLEAALIKYAHQPVEGIKASILAEVKEWMHEQLDDISIMVLRRQTLVTTTATAEPVA